MTPCLGPTKAGVEFSQSQWPWASVKANVENEVLIKGASTGLFVVGLSTQIGHSQAAHYLSVMVDSRTTLG